MRNFIRFYVIESEIIISEEFRRKRNCSERYLAIYTKITNIFLHIFGQFHSLEIEISLIKNLRKTCDKKPPVEHFLPKKL